MKIIQVTPYYPPHLGGMEQRVQDLSVHLSKVGHNVTVLASAAGHTPEAKVINKNLTVKYLKGRVIIHTPLFWGLIRELWQAPRDAVVHVHTAFPYVPEVVSIVCSLRKIPYIAHVRIDPEPSTKFGTLLPLYKKIFLRPVLKKAAKIICLTPDYAELVSGKYGIDLDRIAIIPNGTDFARAKIAKTAIHSPVRLLFVGRLSQQKHLDMLIPAIRKVIDAGYTNIALDIVGGSDSGYEKDVEQMIADQKVGMWVTMRGVITGQKLQDMYARSDIFLMSSKQESFGTTLIEAMAKGLPIVASHIPAIRNTITEGENGLLANNNPEHFAKAIIRLIEDKVLYFHCSEQNLIDANRYNWDTVVKETTRVYEEVTR